MGAATRPAAFYGWRVVNGAFVLAAFGWGVGFYGPPVFLSTVREATGWPMAVVSAAVTVHFLAGAATSATLPSWYRRLGARRATKAAAVLLGVGALGWAMAAAPWQLLRGRRPRRCRVGRDERRRSQRHRLAVVRAHPARCAGDGVQRRQRGRYRLLASLGGGDRCAGIFGRGGIDRPAHGRRHVDSRRPGAVPAAAGTARRARRRCARHGAGIRYVHQQRGRSLVACCGAT